jgi:hypothetical protein
MSDKQSTDKHKQLTDKNRQPTQDEKSYQNMLDLDILRNLPLKHDDLVDVIEAMSKGRVSAGFDEFVVNDILKKIC